MEKEKLYIVTMYRWGSRENHSYVIGVFSSEQKAGDAGDAEHKYRGGKYDPEIIEVEIDVNYYGDNRSKKRSPMFIRSLAR